MFKTERIITWAIIGALATSLFTCNNKLKESNLALEASKQTTDSMKNAIGQMVYTQAVITTNNQKQLKEYTDSIFHLTRKYEKRISQIISFYKGVSVTEIIEKLVPYIDSQAVKKWNDSVARKCADVIAFYENNYIAVPINAKDSTKDYSASFTVKKEGVNINYLSIPDSQYIRFVTIKSGILKKNAANKRPLFSKKSVQVQVLHTNPLIKVNSQSSILYNPPKKSRWLEKATLIGAGIFIGTQLSP